jgi:hypothetical protein
MKKRMGVLIFVFLLGMILGTMQPAMLFAAEYPGNPWDIFVYPSHYSGTKLSGPLSVYYFPLGSSCYNMYYTVRLSKGHNLYLFSGSAESFCVSKDLIQESGDIIMIFLDSAVRGIFTNPRGWQLTSIDNGIYNDEQGYPYSRAFVADIEITVKK